MAKKIKKGIVNLEDFTCVVRCGKGDEGMIVLGIDPGTTKSAYVVYDSNTKKVLTQGLEGNDDVLCSIETMRNEYGIEMMAIEMLKSYGMPMGDSCLLTCVWIGRFIEAWMMDATVRFIWRKSIATEICGSPRASDSNIAKGLVNRFSEDKTNLGGGSNPVVGLKGNKGHLYLIKYDMWSALAVSVAFSEKWLRKDYQGITYVDGSACCV